MTMYGLKAWFSSFQPLVYIYNSTSQCMSVGRRIWALTIEKIEEQLSEIDKKIEEFSLQNNSPILSIPGISHFSSTSILAELGDIYNYTTASQIIKFAGVTPYHYESSQFTAQHTAITKKVFRYLRKTLCQIILPVINHNKIFISYYNKKLQKATGTDVPKDTVSENF